MSTYPTWASVFGAAPDAPLYRGTIHNAALQAARIRFDAMSNEFRGVKAIIEPDGSLYRPADALVTLTPKQVAELAPAMAIAMKLGERTLYVIRDTGPNGYSHWLYFPNLKVYGGSEDGNVQDAPDSPIKLGLGIFREFRPASMPIDSVTLENALTIAKSFVTRTINNNRRPFLLADTSGLDKATAALNAELLSALIKSADDGAGVEDLPNV